MDRPDMSSWYREILKDLEASGGGHKYQLESSRKDNCNNWKPRYLEIIQLGVERMHKNQFCNKPSKLFVTQGAGMAPKRT